MFRRRLVLTAALAAGFAAIASATPPAARAATTVPRAVRDQLAASFSGDRERGLYALMRFYDPEVHDDRLLVDRAMFGATSLELAAALQGLCDRAPESDGTLSARQADRVKQALDSGDVAVRAAAVECLERFPAKSAVELRLQQLRDVNGAGLPPVLTRAILAAVTRHPDPRYVEILTRFANRLEVKAGTQLNELTPEGARLVLALAANGTDVEPMFSETLRLASEKDYVLRARLNRIRAAGGDAAALSALVETANVAFDVNLRREAVDLLLSLPDGTRERALAALAERLGDIDGMVRARIVREASREAVAGGETAEAILRRALLDPYPDLRVQAAAGLFDRAVAGVLTPEAVAAVRVAASTEKNPLAAAALGKVLLAEASQRTGPAEPSASPNP